MVSNLQIPAKLPHKEDLVGKYCKIEPLTEVSHGVNLWSSLKEFRDVWTYLINGPWDDESDFRNWLHECENHLSRFYYAAVDLKTGEALGGLCLIDCNTHNKTTEIGGIFFSPKIQKTRIATEGIYLVMDYAFKLGYRRLQWKCNNENEASKDAAKRLGFTFEGTLRNHMISKGKNRDTAMFSITDSEWPKIKDSFEKWLDPKNFDKEGIQKKRLREIRNA